MILRETELELAWQEHWEEIIAQRVLGGPITVFVGLGTPASVLVNTTKRILAAIGAPKANVYVVDPDSTRGLVICRRTRDSVGSLPLHWVE